MDSKGGKEEDVTSQCIVMFENNVCYVSYVVISLHVHYNQMLSYPVLSLHVCNNHVYGSNLL